LPSRAPRLSIYVTYVRLLQEHIKLIFDAEHNDGATRYAAKGCVSAWNKDPVFGVIGIQSGTPGYKFKAGMDMLSNWPGRVLVLGLAVGEAGELLHTLADLLPR
jgi:hypothetical protein